MRFPGTPVRVHANYRQLPLLPLFMGRSLPGAVQGLRTATLTAPQLMAATGTGQRTPIAVRQLHVSAIGMSFLHYSLRVLATLGLASCSLAATYGH